MYKCRPNNYCPARQRGGFKLILSFAVKPVPSRNGHLKEQPSMFGDTVSIYSQKYQQINFLSTLPKEGKKPAEIPP